MAFGVDIFLETKNRVLVNPRADREVIHRVETAISSIGLTNHIFIASSGTENFRPGFVKMVALSKGAFLVAAKSVCATLTITDRDVYYNTLPLFHVGGLSTLARAFVSGCTHLQNDETSKWDPHVFVKKINENNVTITSLVPTQIFDIVVGKLRAPKSLRFVFAGGGALSIELQRQFEELGWSVYSTYGMTETAAMMAYKKSGDAYTLFPHIIDCRTDIHERLQVRSDALFTGYVFIDGSGNAEFEDPTQDGWFTAGDKAVVAGRSLTLLGRETELVKIKGESVSLLDLNTKFEAFRLTHKISQKAVVLAVPEARSGYELCVVSEGELDPSVIETFNSMQLPFERITRTVSLDVLPLTPLGKVDIAATRRRL